MINALKVVGKDLNNIKVVVNGAGAPAIAVLKFIMSAGVKNAILCDSKGIIYEGKKENMNPVKEEMAKITNKDKIKGILADAIVGADVFLGLSVAGALKPEMVKTMAKDSIIFAMANPTPEIIPDVAKAAGARIVATGRSDFPNQVNNCLGFPAIFKGALKVRASQINEKMKLAAAHALASLISEDAEVVKVAKRAASSVGLKPNVKIIFGGTDASNYNKKGIETVVIGMGAKAIHTKEENIAVADMEKAVNLIQYIFKELSERR